MGVGGPGSVQLTAESQREHERREQPGRLRGFPPSPLLPSLQTSPTVLRALCVPENAISGNLN